MHIQQTWLIVFLLSWSSYVSAFYPWNGNGDVQSKLKPKRFIPVHAPGDDGLLRLDLHKVRRQSNTNQFSVVNSNTPTGGANALAINQDGSDYSYFSTMKFGSKSQEMYMLIDTGSANTWVFSSDCKSESCLIHNAFGKEDSTTLVTNNTRWDLAYGTGQVSGIIATDRVAFANFTLNMGFGLATTASSDFNSYPMDGILGLGRQASDQLGTPTIMELLDDQAKLQNNVVGIHLHRAVDNTKDGEILFGGIDTGKFSGSIAYTKTSNDGSWEIPINDMVVGNVAANFTGRSAIIDTGTTFILMPPKDAQVVHRLIPGSAANGEGFTMPCTTTVKFEVKINGRNYEISAKDYMGRPTQTGSSTCDSNIIGHQAFGETQWILGDVFLKNVYAVFDFDNKQIGFGLPGSGGSTTPATTSSPSASGTATATSAVSLTASGSGTPSSTVTASRPSSTNSTDSNLGAESASTNASAKSGGAIGYWKVGFPILLASCMSAFLL